MINSSMEDTVLHLALVLPLLLLAYNFWSKIRTQQDSKRNLPPSPPALPIIGHLHLIKPPTHRSIQNLSNKYGPIISLRFGSRQVIIISSPSAVEECFIKNDIVFANRPAFLTMYKYLTYNSTTVSTSPYGDHWRNLRRISALEIFSSNRLNMFLGIRKDEIKIFLNKLNRVSRNDFATVELKPIFMDLTLNMIIRMVAGKRFYGEDSAKNEAEAEAEAEAKQFKKMISEIFEYNGTSYLGDYLPVLKWLDYNGYEKKITRLGKVTDELLQGLIDEHRGDFKGSFESRNTMISHLLSLQESEPENYSDQIIKGLLLDIIFAATESTALTLEWAMSSLLNNPQVLEKTKNELDIQIGEENLMDESDLTKLPYLQNIITETLRLYPPAPLLMPHFSSQECSVGGYHVESNTMLLVNAWTIHTSSELWDDAVEFKPERFESIANDRVYKLMPFGLGRRSCPGMGLANRVLGFTLGSMIHCFEWKRVSEQKIDMSEGVGLSMAKAEPLQAMYKTRDIMKKVMSSNSLSSSCL